MIHQLAQKRLATFAVGQHVVEADAGPYEHLLHTGQFPQAAQKPHVVAVVGAQGTAGLAAQAALVGAGAGLQLLAQAGARKFAVGPPTSLM